MEILNDQKQPIRKQITLCGVQGCCPTVNYIEDGVVIKDDLGGEVTLSNMEWRELVEGIKNGVIV